MGLDGIAWAFMGGQRIIRLTTPIFPDDSGTETERNRITLGTKSINTG
jgi:hypothetical protein